MKIERYRKLHEKNDAFLLIRVVQNVILSKLNIQSRHPIFIVSWLKPLKTSDDRSNWYGNGDARDRERDPRQFFLVEIQYTI